jgi:uncharacterized membrane protein YeaQ/YmgE (transglycosylase-associated protein family)
VGIFWWIVVGFVAGAFARAVTKGAPDAGCIFTTVIGVIGALIGGALFNAVGDHDLNDSILGSMFVAFIGACVLLLIVGLFTKGRFGGDSRWD